MASATKEPKIKRRPPIREGGFRVLVVPKPDVTMTALTIPTTMRLPEDRDFMRVVAQSESGDVGANLWAFDRRASRSVIKQLRELADFLEKHALPD